MVIYIVICSELHKIQLISLDSKGICRLMPLVKMLLGWASG